MVDEAMKMKKTLRRIPFISWKKFGFGFSADSILFS
jgi:hypothetical protein